ncbi:hypothetical protein ALC57_08716 [Trachymyrmex cornetzi]|uniref:Uncharacterized protein n=1 Tax=Trachymyrmex cornetzi TaxID=471704 RepID=A0A195E1P4_9HYME|nr:hypothetical protein ALC57_08716 [Trachymyrmex cornetzi]
MKTLRYSKRAGDDERMRKKEKERRGQYGRAFLIVKISGISDLRWLLALITTCCELRWPLSSNGTNQPNQTTTAATKQIYLFTRPIRCTVRRTVLKGLIGHSNSSGDQAPWECDGKNPVSCAELNTVPASLFITSYR